MLVPRGFSVSILGHVLVLGEVTFWVAFGVCCGARDGVLEQCFERGFEARTKRPGDMFVTSRSTPTTREDLTHEPVFVAHFARERGLVEVLLGGLELEKLTDAHAQLRPVWALLEGVGVHVRSLP